MRIRGTPQHHAAHVQNLHQCSDHNHEEERKWDAGLTKRTGRDVARGRQGAPELEGWVAVNPMQMSPFSGKQTAKAEEARTGLPSQPGRSDPAVGE